MCLCSFFPSNSNQQSLDSLTFLSFINITQLIESFRFYLGSSSQSPKNCLSEVNWDCQTRMHLVCFPSLRNHLPWILDTQCFQNCRMFCCCSCFCFLNRLFFFPVYTTYLSRNYKEFSHILLVVGDSVLCEWGLCFLDSPRKIYMQIHTPKKTARRKVVTQSRLLRTRYLRQENRQTQR